MDGSGAGYFLKLSENRDKDIRKKDKEINWEIATSSWRILHREGPDSCVECWWGTQRQSQAGDLNSTVED